MEESFGENERNVHRKKGEAIREVGSTTMALLMRNVLYTRVMYYWAFNRCMHDVTQKVGGVWSLFEPLHSRNTGIIEQFV